MGPKWDQLGTKWEQKKTKCQNVFPKHAKQIGFLTLRERNYQKLPQPLRYEASECPGGFPQPHSYQVFL